MSESKASEPIEPDATAPQHQPISEAPSEPDMVHLPAVIADEYGMSRSEARQIIMLGTVEIDGVEQPAKKLDFPEDELIGKTITAQGEIKSVAFMYRGPQRDRYTGDRFA